jgi:hypothetical protein
MSERTAACKHPPERSPAPPGTAGDAIAAHHLIPDVLGRHPELRAVFDRYGLRGCGGDLGPVETVAYFARAHGVALENLLRDLNEPQGSASVEPEPSGAERAADAIYRRFFLAGIAATLTAGATWGAILLWRLASARSFQAISVPEVNAHGHAQIFGWVGLFVMGFAYQAFPRFKHTSLRWPRLALATFPVYLGGLVLRTVAEPFASKPSFLGAALGGSVLELSALLVFAWIVAVTILRSPAPRTASDAYLLTATFWFVVQGIYDAVLLVLTSTAPTADVLVERVATFQAPLRDIQLHGFALLMILGVSQRFLPGMLGLGTVPPGRSLVLLCVLNAGLLAEVTGFFGFRTSGSPGWAILLWGGVALIAAGAGDMAFRLKVFARSDERERSLKFIRAAYGWLGVSLAMLLLFPLYLHLTAQQFSHAYFGATRHAITVGFISLMILGVASKVVPTLNGISSATLGGLWAPFALVNAGCAFRVLFQTLTDLGSWAFPFAGASGVLEVCGLALWGGHIARVIWSGSRRRRTVPPESSSSDRPRSAAPEQVVGWLTRVAPETIEVFAAHGFQQIRNPLLRATVANTVTIRQACRLKSIDEAKLLQSLNAVLAPATAAGEPELRVELPVLDRQSCSPAVAKPPSGR